MTVSQKLSKVHADTKNKNDFKYNEINFKTSQNHIISGRVWQFDTTVQRRATLKQTKCSNVDIFLHVCFECGNQKTSNSSGWGVS